MSDTQKLSPEIEDLIGWSEEAKEALRTGGNWESKPSDVSGADQFVSPCDTCTLAAEGFPDEPRYHINFVVVGTVIFEGELSDARWSIDSDGDGWDEPDTCAPNEPAYQHWLESYSEETRREEWKGYYEQVIRTGIDYLGVFSAGTPSKIEQKVEWKGIDVEGGILVMCWRFQGELKWKMISQMPEHVTNYFFHKYVPEVPIITDFESVEQLVKDCGDTVRTLSENGVLNGMETVESYQEPDNVAELVKAAAQEALNG